jgi:CubicO group peptidase (beta-lactamase class C family)/beta-glucosidase-like glycosyl hydrolase
MLKKVLTIALLLLGITSVLPAQSPRNQWVDSVFQTLGVEEKIGQLFMVPVYAKTDSRYLEEIENDIKSHRIGGLVIVDGGPVQIARLKKEVGRISAVPPFMAVYASNGLGNALDSTMTFPSMLTLGAIHDPELVYDLGAEIARQMKVLGIHINFAPPADRVTRTRYDSLERSFGENKVNIAEKAVAYMRGLQDNGVLACAKHFPIRGLTVVDVGKDGLPILNAYIDSVEAHPYRSLFSNRISGVLTASSEFPLFYEKKKVARKNKFSPAVLTSIYAGQWLKNVMKYEGLVFVSIPDIQDNAGLYKGGEAELLAFQAGNDIILFPEEPGPAVRKIKRLLRKEPQYVTLLDERVKKILAAKYDAGLSREMPTPEHDLFRSLHTDAARRLNSRLLEHAVTAARNDRAILPIRLLENKTMATLSIGLPSPNAFTSTADKYAMIAHFVADAENSDDLAQQLKPFTTIIAAIYSDPAKYPDVMDKLASLQAEHDVVLVVFGSPLWLASLDRFDTVVEAFSGGPMLGIVPQILFGALPADGKLPITVSPAFPVGNGDSLADLHRLGYSFPEDVGLDSRVLKKIETIAQEAMVTESTPGCYVLVARDGKVVYEKAFGYLTYDNLTPVTENTIYDLASVTKVSATLQTVMFMHDRGLIDINRKASYYLPELKNSNKQDYTLKDILTHQAGLWPFLPFWAQTMKESVYLPGYYDTVPSSNFPYVVADGLFANVSMKDSLWNWIIGARVRDKPVRTPYDYRYSDMGFYILQHLAETMLNQPIEDFLQQNLYEPLGAGTTGYLPLSRFPKSQIAPTEKDTLFRKRLLVGTVHDQGAAMHGGIAGHAGLFSNANDLAKLGQMWLQEGYYGGMEYYKPETVRFFTKKQFDSSRRGLGWDKPVLGDWRSPTSSYASPRTFGHTGFTGTCIWVDPEFNLVYIFLSNRVNPIMTNNKLLSLNIRSRIQDVIYESIFSYCKDHPVDGHGDLVMEYRTQLETIKTDNR